MKLGFQSSRPHRMNNRLKGELLAKRQRSLRVSWLQNIFSSGLSETRTAARAGFKASAAAIACMSLSSLATATEPPDTPKVEIRLILAPSAPIETVAPQPHTKRVAFLPMGQPHRGASGLPPVPPSEQELLADPPALALPPGDASVVLPSDSRETGSVVLPLQDIEIDRLRTNADARRDRSTVANNHEELQPAPNDNAKAENPVAHKYDSASATQNAVTPQAQDSVTADLETLLKTELADSAANPSSKFGRSVSGVLRPLVGRDVAEPAPLPPRTADSTVASRTKLEDAEGQQAAQTIESAPASPLELDGPKTDHQQISPKEAQSGEVRPGAECPGGLEGEPPALQTQPDDIPLEQSAHPYDAPSSRDTNSVPIDKDATKRSSAKQFTARERAIEQRINECLEYFLTHPENVVRRGPWALMHATLPFGVEAEIIAGNKRVNAIGWMCFNGVCAKQRMFQPTRTGFRTNLGPGVQGHEGQFLAILAQSQVASTYPLQVGKNRYTVQDLVRYEMATCREKSELTFKLIGLSHYLPAEQRWRDNRGKIWDLEKMVAEELAQPVIGAACGGSHRLMGLSFAVIQRQRQGLPMTGHWARAEKFVNDYINYAMRLQNPDGSFSTEWFEGRGMDRDIERRVQTTGHILEWLVYSLPEEHLRNERIQNSIEFLLQSVGANPSRDWPIGPRGHALRALSLYNQRVFDVEAGKLTEHIANQKSTLTVR